MAQALEYEPRVEAPPSRALGFFANVAAGYPLLLLGSLYGQWLLSWWVLGHRPQPLLEDPKYISGASWMHLVTFLALLGFVPMGCVALTLNALHAARPRVRLAGLLTRIGVVVSLWVGTVALLRWDPGRVAYWWFD